MRSMIIVAIAVGVIAGPAAAQNIGDVGRLLQDQVLPRPGPDPRQQERDRAVRRCLESPRCSHCPIDRHFGR